MHAMRGRTWLGILAVALAAATLATGCTGAVDKTGEPVVLRMASTQSDLSSVPPVAYFVQRVEKLSGGSLRIHALDAWGTQSPDHEQQLVHAVSSGSVDLGWSGAGVFDTLGVDSFQALVAPFLVDSVQLETRALQTPFAPQALAAVRHAGVVGIALLPGRMRRPLGVRRPLVSAGDYRGARIAIRPAAVAALTFRALGARPAGYIPGDISAFDGAEIDPYTVMAEGFDSYAHEMTGNVVLWPKAWTIVMNRGTFDRLTPEEQQTLLAAGREAIDSEAARVAGDTRVAVSTLCAGRLSFRTASASDRAAMRTAVRSVYTRIERNRLTSRWISAIERLKATAPPDVARCRPK